MSGAALNRYARGAFEQALKTAPDVLILENHDTSRKLGSIKEGNLKLYEDNIGLRAITDIKDRDIAEKARLGKIRGWSFGFKCNDEETEQRADNVPRRIVKALSLSEVSLIDGDNIPCYNGTLVEVRSEGDIIERRDHNDEIHVTEEEKPDYSYFDAVIRYHELTDKDFIHRSDREEKTSGEPV